MKSLKNLIMCLPPYSLSPTKPPPDPNIKNKQTNAENTKKFKDLELKNYSAISMFPNRTNLKVQQKHKQNSLT